MTSTKERVGRKLRPDFAAKVVAALKEEATSWVDFGDTPFANVIGEEVLATLESAESEELTAFDTIELVEGALAEMQRDLLDIHNTFHEVIKTGKRR